MSTLSASTQRTRFNSVLLLVAPLLLATSAIAQPGPVPTFDEAAVERGKAAFATACSFCHGSNARGGETGPDLVRSVLVIDDENGKELGDFLKVGRPNAGMPAFTLPPAQVRDLAEYLHRLVYAAAARRDYAILNIVIGDATRGEQYFNGAGGCKACHSPTGDLKGIASKYEPVVLQDRMVSPRRIPIAGNGEADVGNANLGKKVKVTPAAGPAYEGDLIRINDFHVTLRDAKNVTRTFARNGNVPKVEITDTLQAHVDLWGKYTDQNIHDLTAYLVTLK